MGISSSPNIHFSLLNASYSMLHGNEEETKAFEFQLI